VTIALTGVVIVPLLSIAGIRRRLAMLVVAAYRDIRSKLLGDVLSSLEMIRA
jgi:hypothetical protein